MRAPFPYYGSKYEAAPLIEHLMGPIKNLVLPFAGSLGELLGRSEPAVVETVNDADGLLVNAWRAITYAPAKVGMLVDHPVHEITLHAAQLLLVERVGSLEDMLRADPRAFDVDLAAWWVWGKSCWLGGGWCRTTTKGDLLSERKRPALAGQGTQPHRGYGVFRSTQRPQLSPGGSGPLGRRRPQLSGKSGCKRLLRPTAMQLSGGAGRPAKGNGVHARHNRERLIVMMEELAARLRWVRMTCGDWSRVLTPAVTTSHGLTGVSLDPPYSMDLRKSGLYRHDERGIAEDVCKWALEHGDDPLLRIVIAGKYDEHAELEHGGWTRHVWRERDGETLWASPFCEKIAAPQLELWASQEWT